MSNIHPTVYGWFIEDYPEFTGEVSKIDKFRVINLLEGIEWLSDNIGLDEDQECAMRLLEKRLK